MAAKQHHTIVASRPRGSVLEVLGASTLLGLTSFGGPIAHLEYFREEYVVRRKWLDEHSYADLVALCQFLPGPASSQVGIAIGMLRAGLLGGLVAWLGFTLPSALALVAFAYGVQMFGMVDAGWLHGLKVVAVAVVAQALWGMARTLAPDRPRITIAILAAMAALMLPTASGQVLIIVLAGIVGWRLLTAAGTPYAPHTPVPTGRRLEVASWVILFALLLGLPLLRHVCPSQSLAVFDSFFRVGSLVFGVATLCCRCCTRRSSRWDGLITNSSLRVTALRRLYRVHSSPLRLTLVPWCSRIPTVG